MSSILTQELKDFLRLIAINKFNSQFGTNRKTSEFEVRAGVNNSTSKFAYEIYSLITTDYFVIKLYCRIGDVTNIGNYRIESVVNTSVGKGNEVYVADMEVDELFLATNNNTVRQSFVISSQEIISENVLMCEDGVNAIVAGSDTDYLYLD